VAARVVVVVVYALIYLAALAGQRGLFFDFFGGVCGGVDEAGIFVAIIGLLLLLLSLPHSLCSNLIKSAKVSSASSDEGIVVASSVE